MGTGAGGGGATLGPGTCRRCTPGCDVRAALGRRWCAAAARTGPHERRSPSTRSGRWASLRVVAGRAYRHLDRTGRSRDVPTAAGTDARPAAREHHDARTVTVTLYVTVADADALHVAVGLEWDWCGRGGRRVAPATVASPIR